MAPTPPLFNDFNYTVIIITIINTVTQFKIEREGRSSRTSVCVLLSKLKKSPAIPPFTLTTLFFFFSSSHNDPGMYIIQSLCVEHLNRRQRTAES